MGPEGIAPLRQQSQETVLHFHNTGKINGVSQLQWGPLTVCALPSGGVSRTSIENMFSMMSSIHFILNILAQETPKCALP